MALRCSSFCSNWSLYQFSNGSEGSTLRCVEYSEAEPCHPDLVPDPVAWLEAVSRAGRPRARVGGMSHGEVR